MVRLVFRPYTQLRRSICTSESLRSSIRVSPDFNLARHSSPSFGSQRVCSCCSARCEVEAKRRDCARRIIPQLQAAFAFTTPLGLVNPMTRTHVRLLGPCFKTGQRRRRPTRNRDASRASEDTRYTSLLSYPPGPKLGTRGFNTRKKLHPWPQSRPSGSLREELEKSSQRKPKQTRQVLADQEHASRADISLNLQLRLRERLCLPLHSFTYS